ncbi:unnamed protein product [Kuraishia capsulata CBS 1993]|uniref:Peptide transporter PTR2 n=1 Tax=Kuraishia capsulata CBS 1993 TaxID=1382522 RepID=W6MG45_9ASCO|nr:uncharacterized protein KUCA_T00000936001 [Kuraishia capsulata CBS 1993]CDK24969.1 unnamed protein product [Kuraishia capsulata CBS 1993]
MSDVETDAKILNEKAQTPTGEGYSIVSLSDGYDYNDPNNYSTWFVDEYNPQGLRKPTQQEASSLRRILGRAKYSTYLICLIELAERASYYSVQGLLYNFIQRPLPAGSTTGAPLDRHSSESAGGLGRGLQASNGLTLLLTFMAYVVPLFGGYVADTKIGRLKAIWIGVGGGFISHVLFIIAAIPSVLTGGAAIAPTILAILTLAIGTGFIKPNLLPLLMDQYPYETDMVRVLPSGEKVIVDRAKSFERMTLVFYWAINIGAFFQLATSYCARDVGYWLAFFVPMIMYLFLPIVLFYVQPKLVKEQIRGSILTTAKKIFRVAYRKGWIKRYLANEFWDYAKPSKMLERGEKFYKEKTQSLITWDDQWVLDVKQTVNACKIFLYLPIYNLCDSGIGSVETSQAGSMDTAGVPNDLFNNFNPLAIIIFIPFLDYVLYPLLRKYKLDFKPVYRIAVGFIFGALSQVAGAIIQWKIYTTSPCGYYATTCDETSPITAWQEVSVYILSGVSECFVMTTSYELAYTRAPPQMKSLVMAINLFTMALSSALGEAITPALNDPHLIWPFVAIGIAGFISAFVFLYHYRNLHIDMENERIIREALEDKKNSDNAGPTGLSDDRNLAAVTSIKSAAGK